MSEMRAVVCTEYGSPDVLKIVKIERPVPYEDESLIKIAADCRVRISEVPLFLGLLASLMLGLIKPWEMILGMEISGEIQSICNRVKQFKKGDKFIVITLVTFGG